MAEKAEMLISESLKGPKRADQIEKEEEPGAPLRGDRWGKGKEE